MDDVTVGGPEAQVAGDIETIRSKGGEIGLHLNNKKCELIRKDGRSSNRVFQSFVHVETTDATLLGAPLTNGRSMDTALLCRCDDPVKIHRKARFGGSTWCFYASQSVIQCSKTDALI